MKVYTREDSSEDYITEKFENNGLKTDLHLSLKVLTGGYTDFDGTSWEGLSPEEIGKVYATSVLTDLSKHWLSRRGSEFEHHRDAKRLFQEATRIIFYNLAHLLNPDLTPQKEIERTKADYFSRSQEIDLGEHQIVRGTIENYVAQLYLKRRFDLVGSAILEGSKSYFNEKPDPFRKTQFKVFLEYNRLQKQLRKNLESITLEAGKFHG
ncbi:hypothetical protein HOC13_04745 [Candidatus Woesearchaeota archaeon]|jgi:hypothetical protein|nr:hypothetical protein [Candidatus Woesearchaeota archaeon]